MGKKSPGHIEQLPSGSWRVKVYGGTDPLTGREIRLRKTCKTERAALIELGKLLEQAVAAPQLAVVRQDGRTVEQVVALPNWAHTWIKSGAATKCRPRAGTIQRIMTSAGYAIC